MGTTLVVNPGSSSRKYALYRQGESVLEMGFEETNTGFEMCSRPSGSQQVCGAISGPEFTSAFAKVAEEVESFLKREMPERLDAVVIRVVAPGTFFQRHAVVDDVYMRELRKRESSAPLHIPTMIREIKNIKQHFPKVPLIAASDSMFHSEMPERSRDFSIASRDADLYDIHRFGYHGLSVSSIVRRIHAVIGKDPERMIVCHIGSGVSVTAVKQGKGVETTMGFSPTTGLPMGNRAGDIDTAALLELMRVKNFKPSDAEMYLNSSGGLAGIAKDSDIRRLLDRRSQHDALATKALDLFSYSIQKAIAALTISLGGVEVLVLTATAAVRSAELRALVLNGLEHLGIQISKDRNDMLAGKDGVISVNNSKVKVVVMRTDEMGEMAQVARQFISVTK